LWGALLHLETAARLLYAARNWVLLLKIKYVSQSLRYSRLFVAHR
jgi:hypothetical protein